MEKELGLYIHIPFCVSKCHYCNFVSATNKNHLMADYLKCLLKEIEKYSSLAKDSFKDESFERDFEKMLLKDFKAIDEHIWKQLYTFIADDIKTIFEWREYFLKANLYFHISPQTMP